MPEDLWERGQRLCRVGHRMGLKGGAPSRLSTSFYRHFTICRNRFDLARLNDYFLSGADLASSSFFCFSLSLSLGSIRFGIICDACTTIRPFDLALYHSLARPLFAVPSSDYGSPACDISAVGLGYRSHCAVHSAYGYAIIHTPRDTYYIQNIDVRTFILPPKIHY